MDQMSELEDASLAQGYSCEERNNIRYLCDYAVVQAEVRVNKRLDSRLALRLVELPINTRRRTMFIALLPFSSINPPF
jgi:hypothetical protein